MQSSFIYVIFCECFAFDSFQENDSDGFSSYGKFLTGLSTNVVSSSLNVFEVLGKKAFENLTVADKVCF